jgi:hypothetical protein
MSRERIVRAAMLAYPPEVRNARGSEMLDTALDVTRESPRRLLRESLALARSGLRARAGVTAEAGTRRLTANVCAQGATVWGLVLLIAWLHLDKQIYDNAGSVPQQTLYIAYQVLLALAIAAALIGYDRISAVFGLAWIVVLLDATLTLSHWLGGGSHEWVAHWISFVAVPLACYLVMLLRPRARRRDARRLLWLAVAVLIGLAFPVYVGVGYGLGLSGMVLLVLALAGLFLLPAGSSLPLAFALVLVAHGLSLWTLPGGFALTEAHSVRWAMTTVVPVLLTAGAALRLVSARRSLAD